MCGIVGVISRTNVQDDLLTALEALEYRGYDSAGIALNDHGTLHRIRALGKLANLKNSLNNAVHPGTTGIGHIRWATHGKPSLENSHPHASRSLMMVHNGIIENHNELRNELQSKGFDHVSQTDTEVFAHLIQYYLDQQIPPLLAFKQALKKVRGAYAVAVVFEGAEDYMIAARHGSPLVVGRSSDKLSVGSDVLCIASVATEVCYLQDGDLVELHGESFKIFDQNDELVDREFIVLDSTNIKISKDGYDHYMLKEIYEQPDALQSTLNNYLDENKSIVLPFNDIDSFSKIIIIACGTSYYAGMIAKYWIESVAKISVDVDIASEFRYRDPPLSGNELAIFISQSGETADTLAAHAIVQAHKVKTVAIVNVKDSSLARACDLVLQTFAGTEVGVASTKAFTSQLILLAMFAVFCAQQRKTKSVEYINMLVDQLLCVPDLLRLALQKNDDVKTIASSIMSSISCLYLGRGSAYPLALEGALKLKEISYIHGEAYASGEMKHGPIALIDENMPVIVVAPFDNLYEKSMSNLEEVKARGGRIILISDKTGLQDNVEDILSIEMPECNPLVMPIIYSVPLQLLAYHVANMRGADVDQPRNLAKSVTVE